MMFGAWGNTDHDDSIRIIHRALDAGINFVDTADVYSGGESEEIVGKALEGPSRRRRAGHQGASLRWATTRTTAATRAAGSSREVENSLRRLRTDRIDLYQIHRPDPTTDVEETLGALTDLVRQGKVRAIGSSTFPRGRSSRRSGSRATRRLERFRTEQPPYSILVRGIERDVLPVRAALRHGHPRLEPARRRLARRAAGPPTARRPHRARQRLAAPLRHVAAENQRKLDAVEQLAPLADDAGLSLIELAIAFVVNHPAVTSAIIGPRTMEQLDGQLPRADVALDEATSSTGSTRSSAPA